MSTLSHGLQLLKKYYEIMVGDREKIASLTIPPPVISVIFYEESSGSFFSTFSFSFQNKWFLVVQKKESILTARQSSLIYLFSGSLAVNKIIMM